MIIRGTIPTFPVFWGIVNFWELRSEGKSPHYKEVMMDENITILNRNYSFYLNGFCKY